MPWLHDSVGVLADALPNGVRWISRDEFHQVSASVLAPALAEIHLS